MPRDNLWSELGFKPAKAGQAWAEDIFSRLFWGARLPNPQMPSLAARERINERRDK